MPSPVRVQAVHPTATTPDELHDLARAYGIPWLDVAFIALNMQAVRSDLGYPRARMQLLPATSDEVWQVILPLDNPQSAFLLDAEGITLDGTPVARLQALENDDVVLYYLRGGGAGITLNTHSRSTCTGCLFCPNVIEDAADATLDTERELGHVLSWIEADNEWTDLAHVESLTVCSGCFHRPEAAIDHMAALRRAASHHGFDGRLHLLSSVVRERQHLERMADEAGPFQLTITLECFTRRDLLLKDTKASLTMDDACRILDDCADLGILGDFTYVVGLDGYEDARSGLLRLIDHATWFPRIQVYQAHNDYMRRARNPEAADIRYYLDIRAAIEGPLAQRGLVPRSWDNYRPLWYSAFGDQPVAGPRI